ncbi:MAG: thiol:disulfide interchange protein [Gammaproteobacteria bacterium]|jgi:thiol:disulfide interchange protein
MNAPGILMGVAVAIVASITGSVLFTLLPVVFSPALSLRLTITVLTAAYVVFLLRKGRKRSGKVTLFMVWGLLTSAGLLLELPTLYYVPAQATMIWLVRSITFQRSILAALFDLALIAFGLLAACWALLQTGSLAIALWSFFLVQSLFCLISRLAFLNRDSQAGNPVDQDNFQSAHRVAVDALRKLSIR